MKLFLALVTSLLALAINAQFFYDTPNTVAPGLPPSHLKPRYLDVEAHRGGQGYRPQNTLYSYVNGIQLGASTIEMDMHVTKDGYVVMSHNHYPDPDQCKPTGPIVPNDPLYPYAGKNIINLTLAQIRSLDCGNTLAAYPQQQATPGAKMPLFSEVIELLQCYNVPNVKINTEIKYNSDDPSTTATREVFVNSVADVIRRYNFQNQTVLQSFDW